MEVKNIDKKTAVFEGIIDLINSGVDIYAMKVSEIAAAAGMGKGTVYDYFTSKEEMVAGAVAYNIRKGIGKVRATMAECEGFEQKYFAVLEFLDKEAGNGIAIVMAAIADGGFKKLEECLCEDAYVRENVELVWKMIDGLLAQGAHENIISPTADMGYNRMVVYSSITGYCAYKGNGKHLGQMDAEHARMCAYRLLVKALA